MQLTTHFSQEEFVATNHRNIDNSLPPSLLTHAIETCQMMERVRKFLGDQPIYMSSGYRCPELNKAVGSAPSSDHLKAYAMDWTCPKAGDPYEICMKLKDHVSELQIGQLIHEFGRWIHCGVSIPTNSVNRVITIDSYGTRSGIWRIR